MLFFAAAGVLLAQPAAGGLVIEVASGQIPYMPSSNFFGLPFLYSKIQYAWSITRAPNGAKQFIFTAKECNYVTVTPTPLGVYFWTELPTPQCTTLTQSQAETLGPIAEGLLSFYNYHPDAPHDPPIYYPNPPGAPPSSLSENLTRSPFAGAAPHVQAAGVQPLTPPDTQMVFLDGLSQNLLQVRPHGAKDYQHRSVTQHQRPARNPPGFRRRAARSLDGQWRNAGDGLRFDHAVRDHQYFDAIVAASSGAGRDCVHSGWDHGV